MISSLAGKITYKTDKFIILEVGGVGYKIFLSGPTFNKIPEIGALLKLFTYLAIKEDAMDLYGFLDADELDLFETLLSITGIGPKIALKIAALGPLGKLQKEIEEKDGKVFEGIPGIGTKKAQTIILELSGKIKEAGKISLKHHDEAEDALVSLGFSRQTIKEALLQLPKEIKDLEQKIKEALKILGNKQ